MPARDGTGPAGKGPRTGGGKGGCPVPPSWDKYEEDRKTASGRRPRDGRGKGRGMGRGRRNRGK